MLSIRRLDGRSIALLLFGGILLIGSLWAFPQVPGTEYHARTDLADDEEGTNASEIGYNFYEFEELSPEAQRQFRKARNDSDNSLTFSEEGKKAPEFQYGEHGSTITYVAYEGESYRVATSSSSCFAAVCDFLRWTIGFVAFTGVTCIGFGLWRMRDREA